ncbi:hypothetical protein CVT24_010448 [Panaeolus cyanescens]|uniref:Uncharacterized protein n=1 Tax=Panaeolus cyanescens TaxID=181874 RepID=A0A409YPQ4_9AGAR|nr:hypothetical protein CVT24_010448 [Panaeolus cyanescens]
MSGTLNDPASWKPVGQTSEQIFEDGVKLIAGTTINDVSYGIVLTLYFMCINALIQQYQERTHRIRSIFSAVYITIMFAAGTFYCAVNAREAQLAFVDNPNLPGDAVAYNAYTFDTPFNVAGVVSFFLTAWMNDALLSITGRFGVSMGMVALIETVLPTRSFWAAISLKFVMAYYALTVAYTVLITSLMTLRILLARREFIKATGQKGYGAQYLSIATMIVESSALYSVWGLVFLGLYIANHPVQYVFLASLSEVQVSGVLVIVSTGKAWSADTTHVLSRNGQDKTQEKSRMTAIVFYHSRGGTSTNDTSASYTNPAPFPLHKVSTGEDVDSVTV